jgi:hypothetical protein
MSIAFVEGGVTRLRRELKLVLSPEQALRVCQRLGVELGDPVPTQITSIYFDQRGLPLGMRALRTPNDCVKVRTKEYFPDRGAGQKARVVLEMKRERRGITQKRRIWMPRNELRRVLSQGQRQVLLPLFSLHDYAPVAAVTYQRQVFQNTERLRITVDAEIQFHPVTLELALGVEPVSRTRLGPPAEREPEVVVELKLAGAELPRWLLRLVTEKGSSYSKFAEAMKRLHLRRVGGVRGGSSVHRL